MKAPFLHTILNQKFWLSGQRSLYWEQQKALIVSDLHFGKTGHFRKAGIAVPQHIYKEDLQRLITLLHYFKPKVLIVVGDFFHSHANRELELFKRWRADFSELEITLVKGNHDILKNEWYEDAHINVVNDLLLDTFFFTHELIQNDKAVYTFSGHIHPGISLNGIAKQSLQFPCFYFAKHYCVLPAFSKFTGTVRIHPQRGENVFAIVENNIIKL